MDVSSWDLAKKQDVLMGLNEQNGDKHGRTLEHKFLFDDF